MYGFGKGETRPFIVRVKRVKMIDEIIKVSWYCYQAIRDSERHKDFKEFRIRDLKRAEGYLNHLQNNAPLMYAYLLPEYIKASDSLYITLDKEND